jgi:very-short-patch-repair endonuclease
MNDATRHEPLPEDARAVDSRDARCGMLAAEQHGCLTLDQARRAGLSDEAVARRVRAGEWRRVLPCVYALRAAPHTWEQQLVAATLWAGDGAAVSGAAAAAVWEFPDFGRCAVEISHAGTKRGLRGIRVRRVVLPPNHVTSNRGIRVTTPARTLSDIAASAGVARFDAAFHYCLHRGLATLGALREVAEHRTGPGFPGSSRFLGALAAYGEGAPAASPLEARLASRLVGSEIPPARRQHQVIVEGRTRYLDFAWPDRMVTVEVDGYRWHSSRRAWREDRERLAALRRAGWTVLNVAREDVDERFGDLVDELRTLLR